MKMKIKYGELVRRDLLRLLTSESTPAAYLKLIPEGLLLLPSYR